MTLTTDDFVPEWAKRAIWYQIFPDRFWNGDPRNDPTLESLRNAYPHDVSAPWQVHPWTADWYELQPYERANGRGLWHALQRRRYGGDLQGILDRLDYLQDLGVTALYLNPVFEAPSAHKYDGATYHHIDPHLGPDPDGDRRLIAAETPDDPRTWAWTAADQLLRTLIAEAHRRGLRLILDGVFNHVGLNHWAFQDVIEHGPASRFKDWFKITDWRTPTAHAPFTYTGWFGVPELPEWRQDEGGLVAGPRDYIFACTRRWMDPDGDGDPRDGVDGWRLDVAFCVRHGFWKDWRRHVKALNPAAYLTAEIVTEDANEPYLQGDEFDAVMNYLWAFTCAEFFLEEPRLSVSEFDRQLRALREAYPACVAYGMQNLLDSHDTARLASRIVNRARSQYRDWKSDQPQSKVAHQPAYETRRPTAEARALQKLMTLFQMTYVGAPMIYYGDEAGLWGANDPCDRKPMLWPELTYAPEAYQPDGAERAAPDPVAFDLALFHHYQTLLRLRRASNALQVGDFQTLLTEDAAGVYVFQRTHGSECVIVALNRDPLPQRASVPATGRWVDVLNGGVVTAEEGRLGLELAGQWGAVLERAAAPGV